MWPPGVSTGCPRQPCIWQVHTVREAQLDGCALIQARPANARGSEEARPARPSFARLLSCELLRLKTDYGASRQVGLIIFARRVTTSLAATRTVSAHSGLTRGVSFQRLRPEPTAAPPVRPGPVPPRLQHAEAERLQRDHKIRRDYALRLLRERSVGTSSKSRRSICRILLARYVKVTHGEATGQHQR